MLSSCQCYMTPSKRIVRICAGLFVRKKKKKAWIINSVDYYCEMTLCYFRQAFGPKLSSHGHRRFLSDWAHMPYCWFSHEAVQLYLCKEKEVLHIHVYKYISLVSLVSLSTCNMFRLIIMCMAKATVNAMVQKLNRITSRPKSCFFF